MLKKLTKRVKAALAAVGFLAAVPSAAWLSLTYEPSYYRAMVNLTREQREGKARHFVAQSLQLRNDIVNEPTWEAVFSDQEVNAWLAEDLVTYFADQLPPEVHDPRVLFETDRVILAFQLNRNGVQSIITVIARPRVPEGNTVELTLEKIRAGILPVPADNILDRITEYARMRGVDVRWQRRDGYPVVVMKYTPNLAREDVQLEELEIRGGQIRLAGRSDRTKGAFYLPTLPSRRVLQSTFPSLNTQVYPSEGDDEMTPEPASYRSTVPTS
ncbi:hypothetical protein OJF2_20360 [Aquisphaera giovannonii]|uniref:Uncharacterized protein n=2 Tax=Aquisphaera giovannonii TaxID=406548 RepID=A0A5B9W014_9BACT|nr:hypothetical protein OJF2_20360 [Aquisphaera giovannonii]